MADEEFGCQPWPVFVVDDIQVEVINDLIRALDKRATVSTIHGPQDYKVHIVNGEVKADTKSTKAPVSEVPTTFIGKSLDEIKAYWEDNVYYQSKGTAERSFLILDKKSASDKTALIVSMDSEDPAEARAEFAVATELLVNVEQRNGALNEGVGDDIKRDGLHHYTEDLVNSKYGK